LTFCESQKSNVYKLLKIFFGTIFNSEMDYIFGTEIEPLPLLLTAKTAIHWGMFGLRSTITSKSAHKMQEKKLWQMART